MSKLRYVKGGNMFTSNAQTLVNPVNCRGVMGAGLALIFKQKYPDMFIAYVQACRSCELRIGQPMLYRASQPWILNFPTKDHWRSPAKLSYIEQGLQFFAANYRQMNIESIAFPKLGAGLGHLSWNDVDPLMARYLAPLDCNITIYIEDGDPLYAAAK